ncbi:MAG: SH3 domain-containing protein [Christensenellaceae bacterium]|jgi:N-acetylmuramoyl-L-alanine amidase|nr:SH3 domain-containing protein [Christensenellaceae bacterium]
MKKLLALVLVALLCLAMAAPALAADEVGAVVTARALNLRSGAGTNYSILGTYPRGTVVSVESITGNWAKVILLGDDGELVEGWMHIDYLSLVVVDLDDEVVADDGVESKVLPQSDGV